MFTLENLYSILALSVKEQTLQKRKKFRNNIVNGYFEQIKEQMAKEYGITTDSVNTLSDNTILNLEAQKTLLELIGWLIQQDEALAKIFLKVPTQKDL